MIKRFQEVREAAKGQPLKKLAIVSAHAPHTVRSGLIAQEEGIAVPIFIGERETIETLLRNEGLDPKNFRIEAADGEEAAALRAVELARSTFGPRVVNPYSIMYSLITGHTPVLSR